MQLVAAVLLCATLALQALLIVVDPGVIPPNAVKGEQPPSGLVSSLILRSAQPAVF